MFSSKRTQRMLVCNQEERTYIECGTFSWHKEKECFLSSCFSFIVFQSNTLTSREKNFSHVPYLVKVRNESKWLIGNLTICYFSFTFVPSPWLWYCVFAIRRKWVTPNSEKAACFLTLLKGTAGVCRSEFKFTQHIWDLRILVIYDTGIWFWVDRNNPSF